MTLSFLWWLPIVKAPYVKKKSDLHGTNVLQLIFHFRYFCHFPFF